MVGKYITDLHLQPHPEGGYYKETYRSKDVLTAQCLPAHFDGTRQISTAIYFLLQQGDFSAFHRIKSDECWHYYAGDTLLIHVLHNNGTHECIRLGASISAEEMFQFVVPASTWFAAECAGQSSFVLAGCTVAPGFDFADFEIANKDDLIKLFPVHREIISKLCR